MRGDKKRRLSVATVQSELNEFKGFVLKRLSYQRAMAWCVANKKKFYDYDRLPNEVRWLFMGNLEVGELTADTVELHVYRGTVTPREHLFSVVVGLEWVYYSDWDTGKEVRDVIRLAKSDGSVGDYLSAKRKLQRRLERLNMLGEFMRDDGVSKLQSETLRKLYSEEKQQVLKERKRLQRLLDRTVENGSIPRP